MLGAYHLVDQPLIKSFTYRCQHRYGGISKCDDADADPLHTYLGLCGLSLAGETSLAPIDPALGIPM